MPVPDPDTLLSSSHAAALLGIQPQTLRKWRVTGRGPAFVRFGGPMGRAAYRRATVTEWIATHEFPSTSAEAAHLAAPARPVPS